MSGAIWVLCALLLLPAESWAAAGTTYLPRENVRTVSAATYTTVAADLSRVIELTNTSGATVTLSNQVTGWFVDIINTTAATAMSIGPATGTINGQAGVALAAGGSCRLVYKNPNWLALCGGSIGVVTPPPPPPPPGPTYYVSTTGNDAANGQTLGTAWATLTKAANTLVAGDTVLIQDGTYTEPAIRPINNGTSTLPITFKAQNKQLAILNSTAYYTGIGCAPAFNIHKSWIVVDGLKIQPAVSASVCGSSPTSSNVGVRCWDDGTPALTGSPNTGNQGCTLRNLLVVNVAGKFDGAVKTNQDFALVEDNTIYSLECFNSLNVIFRRNVISGADAWNSTYLCKGGARNHQFYNNLLTLPGTDEFGGLLIGGSTGIGTGAWNDTTAGPTYLAECINCVAYNNVIVGSGLTNNTTGGTGVGFVGAVDSWIFNNVIIGPYVSLVLVQGFGLNASSTVRNSGFRNNIWDCGSAGPVTDGYHGYQGFVNITMEYNIFYTCTGIPAESTHTLTGNPNFVNRTSDWHVTAGSSAIDSGPPMPTVPGYNGTTLTTNTDLSGTPRVVGNSGTFPNGWDAGVYSFP